MNIADQIKNAITLYDAANRYGPELNQKGFGCCPFHDEKTPSFSVYNHGQNFKCFGCGAGGDVIAYVMQMFDLTFSQAVLRLNEDFGLGLTDRKPDRRKQAALKTEKLKKRQRSEALSAQRKQLILRHRKLWQNYLLKRPNSLAEPLSPEFVKALHQLDYVEFLLSELEEQEAKEHGRDQTIPEG